MLGYSDHTVKSRESLVFLPSAARCRQVRAGHLGEASKRNSPLLSSSHRMASTGGSASATRSRTASPSQRVKADHATSQTSASSRKTAVMPVQPTRTTPHLRPLASILFLTMIVGTIASVYLTSSDLTTFRSRIPASQLNRWEFGNGSQRAFPVPSLPYFADKVSPGCSLMIYNLDHS